MSFPVILDPTIPANTESPSLGASRIRALDQALIDLFNLPAATNISAALTITRVGPYTNSTGVTLNAGDVVALNLGADQSVVLSDVSGSLLQFVVALATITNAATGVFGQTGQVTVTTQGAVTRGNYLRKSATTKALEDTSVAAGAAVQLPAGALGVALTAAAGPGGGTCVAQLFGVTVPTQPTLVGGYGVRNLVGNNNAGTPNTQFDYSADLVVLRNPSSGAVIVQTNTGALTNDTGTTGITANGRDQVAAFGASHWIHFYFIWNGTVLATLSSLTAPPTGPALPTGYTHWAYVGAVYYNVTPLLVKTRMRGAWMYYEAKQNALNAGAETGETAVALTALIPANALSFQTRIFFLPGGTSRSFNYRYISGSDVDTFTTSSGVANYPASFYPITPNVSQQFYYLVANGTDALTVDILGYRVPNGGE